MVASNSKKAQPRVCRWGYRAARALRRRACQPSAAEGGVVFRRDDPLVEHRQFDTRLPRSRMCAPRISLANNRDASR
jgi:hypothetical protein